MAERRIVNPRLALVRVQVGERSTARQHGGDTNTGSKRALLARSLRLNEGMKRIAVLAVVALALTACTSGTPEAPPSLTATPTPTAEPLDAQGALALSPANSITDGTTCLAGAGYTDFNNVGLQVVLMDATGTTVATADLGDVEPFQGGCVRYFTATVPAGGAFYSARVEDWESQTYSEDSLASTTMVVLADG